MRDPLERLAALPVQDVGPESARRIHARARGVFLRQARVARRRWAARLDRWWDGYLEPAAVGVLGLGQLIWVFETVRRLVS